MASIDETNFALDRFLDKARSVFKKIVDLCNYLTFGKEPAKFKLASTKQDYDNLPFGINAGNASADEFLNNLHLILREGTEIEPKALAPRLHNSPGHTPYKTPDTLTLEEKNLLAEFVAATQQFGTLRHVEGEKELLQLNRWANLTSEGASVLVRNRDRKTLDPEELKHRVTANLCKE